MNVVELLFRQERVVATCDCGVDNDNKDDDDNDYDSDSNWQTIAVVTYPFLR